MGGGRVYRQTEATTVVIGKGSASSGEIEFASYSMGILHFTTSGWTTANVGFKVAHRRGCSYRPLYSEYDVLVQISSPSQDRAFLFPENVGPATFIKLWSQDNGTDTTQGDGRTMVLELKG